MQFLGIAAIGAVFFFGLVHVFAASAILGVVTVAVIATAAVTAFEFPSWRG